MTVTAVSLANWQGDSESDSESEADHTPTPSQVLLSGPVATGSQAGDHDTLLAQDPAGGQGPCQAVPAS